MKHQVLIFMCFVLIVLCSVAIAEDNNSDIINQYDIQVISSNNFISTFNIGETANNLGIDIYKKENVDILVIIFLSSLIIFFITIGSMSIYIMHHFKTIPSTNNENNKIELGNIKHYIKANINQYSYDTIKLTLIEQGHDPDDIDKEYFTLKKDNPDDDYRE